jgi:aspartyl-tRNA(Asn)/glutamyl-tRNA(Gln) amidotransferase subunit A
MSGAADLSVAEAASLLHSRELSPVDYVAAFLERIARHESDLNAFLQVFSDSSLADARAAEVEINEGRWRGPLHGVPIALKDLFDIVGEPTTAHSKILRGHRAERSAHVVTKLREAGAIIIGKTALHEFATGGPSFDLPWPPARNPWRRTHHPGGSSSGSAVAVAAGFAPAALGTDTAGSVRNPATCCGVVGMKPTYGAVSRTGVFPLAFSLDHVGPITRGVEDNAILLEAMLGRDAEDPTSVAHPRSDLRADLARGIDGLRIGVIEAFHAEADPEIRAAMDEAIKVIESLGGRIEPIRLSALDTYVGCGRLILQAEAFAIHEHWLKTRPLDYGVRGRVRLLPGAFLSATDYIRAQQLRTMLVREFTQAIANVDAVIAVSSLELPCEIDDEAKIDRTYDRQARTPFNVTGTPALSLPIGFSKSGLPIGMQVLGKAFDEAMIYRIAHAYEQATSWRLRRPDLDPTPIPAQ